MGGTWRQKISDYISYSFGSSSQVCCSTDNKPGNFTEGGTGTPWLWAPAVFQHGIHTSGVPVPLRSWGCVCIYKRTQTRMLWPAEVAQVNRFVTKRSVFRGTCAPSQALTLSCSASSLSLTSAHLYISSSWHNLRWVGVRQRDAAAALVYVLEFAWVHLLDCQQLCRCSPCGRAGCHAIKLRSDVCI